MIRATRLACIALLALAAACRREPTAPAPPAAPQPTRSDTVEARALWVSRYEYTSAADLDRIFADAGRARFNIVYLQVRGVADALYASDIEPCSVRLCGTLGGVPTWDPLAHALAQAAPRGIQVHAWLNAFIGWSAANSGTCALLQPSSAGRPRHVLLDNPHWRAVDSSGQAMPCPNGQGSVWLSPGVPGVRTQLARVAADVARRYAVHGVHLDFIRYPGLQWSYDSASLAAFGRDPRAHAADWAQFRRDQVTATVRETRDSLAAAGRKVLSAAVWGIYRDRWDWRTSEGFGQYFQDPVAWTSAGLLDVAVPMIYWRTQGQYCARTDWVCLADDHLALHRQSGRHVYLGISAETDAQEVVRQIGLARDRRAPGISIFSYGSARSSGLLSLLESGVFRLPARVPDQGWR